MSSSDESDSPLEIPSLNISNDEYYQPLANFKPQLQPIEEELNLPKYGSKTIQHSLPAYDLWRPFFPTYLSEEKFRNFHRPKLRHFNTGPQARRNRRSNAFPIKNLALTIRKFQKQLRFDVISAINKGLSRDEICRKYLRIYKASDLSAKNGEMFLFEYCEENPPVLNQVGMVSNIKTYLQTTEARPGPKKLPVQVKPSQPRQTDKIAFTETNKVPLTNANEIPITNSNGGSQKTPDKISEASDVSQDKKDQPTDKFLGNHTFGYNQVITNQISNSLYFGKLKPDPKFKFIENNLYRAPIFEHEMPCNDFLVIRTRNSFYIREVGLIFTVGQTMPMVEIPKPNESSISRFRSQLSTIFINKLFMESKTEPPHIDSNTLSKLFPDYDPSNLRQRLTRNGCTSIKGKQGLYSRGTSKYGLCSLKNHRTSFTPEQYCTSMAMLAARQRLRELNYTESMIDPPDDAELEPEVLAAPWNTSKAVISTLKGQSYLDLKRHLVDPTGLQREGFSCVQWSRSPTEEQQIKDRQNSSKNTPSQLDISKIPDKNPLLNKIKNEKLERLATFQREAQIIFEVQSNVLSSKEVLSSDEDDDVAMDEENQLDNSFDEQLRDLDRLVVGGQSVQELNYEKEEEERRKMLEEFQQNEQRSTSTPMPGIVQEASEPMPISVATFKNKILRIVRTYDTPEGQIQRTELVREPKIIALYIKQKGGQQSCDSQKSYNNHRSDNLTPTSGGDSVDQNGRRKSLVPGELCRADGIVLTISKEVLNTRALRKSRRDLRINDSCDD